jgi:hypothetical protein
MAFYRKGRSVALKRKKEGDPITVDDWNEIVSRCNREVRGSNVIADKSGWIVVDRPGGAGGGGTIDAGFAIVLSKSRDAPPFRYTCQQAEMDTDGIWTAVVDGAVYTNCFNIEEQGHGGEFQAALLVDDVVLIFDAPGAGSGNAYVIARAHYRGTF